MFLSPRKTTAKATAHGELASIRPIWFHSLTLSTAQFDDLNMYHFRKSLDPVEMCVRGSEIDKRRVQNRDGATKSIMAWIQEVLTSILTKIGPCGNVGNFLARRATPAGRRRSSSSRREVLMAHFPASLSLSRLAGSSGTQKVCESAKSRNRTGGSDIQVRTLRTVADARSNDPVRSQASSENESV